MKILVINCGSSTLKFEVFEVEREAGAHSDIKHIVSGLIDRIGGQANIELSTRENSSREMQHVADHYQAASAALDRLRAAGLLAEGELAAIGHRVIHGGDKFSAPAIIDDKVIAAIDALSELAPLHNQPSLDAIRAVSKIVGPSVPMVAVFDTAFHRTLPEPAHRYAIPWELAEKHHVHRYGFHGLAHRYMMERYCAITGTTAKKVKLITLQLGNGCSAAAIKNGISIDTSMGLTPLEGLIMGTRSGDVDPSLVGFLARKENTDIRTVDDWLNQTSGLLGVSGLSKDMRELLDAARKGDPRAALAIEMFCYRVKKYIGAYMAVLGGADAVIFGGGIGENASEVRARICHGLEWCGLRLDSKRNQAIAGNEAAIHARGASVAAYVIPVDEAAIIAHDTLICLRSVLKRRPHYDRV